MWGWIVVLSILFCLDVQAQKKWDGGGGNSEWNNGLNWFPDGVPGPADDVVVDNSFSTEVYQIDLPTGSSTVFIRSLIIKPQTSVITIHLPATNTANPGLSISGQDDALVIFRGGIFRNGSGAAAGSGILVNGTIKIYDEGKYIHQTPRSNAGIIDKLSTAAGTAKGIFEFDVPGTAGYTVSLTGNNFGSLSFSAAASGGTKSYSGSGIGTLLIRGDLIVKGNAQLTSTLSADIVLGGNLLVDGKLNMNPSTAGTVSRSLRFIGPDAHFKGNGLVSMNSSFRNIEVAKESFLYLEKPLTLGFPQHAFICRGGISLNDQYIEGVGSFSLLDSATLMTGNENGIMASGDQGSIRTSSRWFSYKGNYLYNGPVSQVTGDALPDTVSSLGVNNGSALILTKNLYITDSLILGKGIIVSTISALLTLGTNRLRSRDNIYGHINQGWDSSYVEGPMALHTKTGVNYVAPVGALGVFAPIMMRKKDSGDQTIIVKYNPYPFHTEALAATLQKISAVEHWQFLSPLPTHYFYGVSYRPLSVEPDSTQLLTIGAFTNGGTNWKSISCQRAGGSYGWLMADTAASNLEALAIGAAANLTVLPIRFISFKGQQEGDIVKLDWTTEEEGKDITYIVERSIDGRTFTPLYNMPSSNRQRAHHYFSDVVPQASNYYRLYMSGPGVSVWSRTIRVEYQPRQLQIYPNPATNLITINFPRSRSKYEVEIVSFTGLVCKKFVCNTATCQIRVDDLRRGLYVVKLTDQFGSITLQLTKN